MFVFAATARAVSNRQCEANVFHPKLKIKMKACHCTLTLTIISIEHTTLYHVFVHTHLLKTVHDACATAHGYVHPHAHRTYVRTHRTYICAHRTYNRADRSCTVTHRTVYPPRSLLTHSSWELLSFEQSFLFYQNFCDRYIVMILAATLSW